VTRSSPTAHLTIAKEVPTVNSIAAYYVLIATETAQQDAARRRAEFQNPRPQRPSIIARARMLLPSARASQADAATGAA